MDEGTEARGGEDGPKAPANATPSPALPGISVCARPGCEGSLTALGSSPCCPSGYGTSLHFLVSLRLSFSICKLGRAILIHRVL